MNKKLNYGIYYIITLLFISCGTNKIATNDTEVNTYPNSEYKKSRKAYSGKLNKSEYDALIKQLELELKVTIDTEKSILINYNQKAPNCINIRFSKNDNKQVAKNRIRISSRISSNFNTVDFFVYSEDSYNKEIYEKMSEFTLDSGFFYKNVFTEHLNCAGFLIVKPNGEFYKYYGEDYYSEVEAFLEKE
jgi:hypothetical protein